MGAFLKWPWPWPVHSRWELGCWDAQVHKGSLYDFFWFGLARINWEVKLETKFISGTLLRVEARVSG